MPEQQDPNQQTQQQPAPPQAQDNSQQYAQDPYTDIGVKLRDIEEKQNIIKDRVLLIGENLVSEKQETSQDIAEINNKIKLIEQEINSLKLAIQRIMDNQENLAKKSEIEILKRQFKMFQPLELARVKDVEEIVNKALKEKIKK